MTMKTKVSSFAKLLKNKLLDSYHDVEVLVFVAKKTKVSSSSTKKCKDLRQSMVVQRVSIGRLNSSHTENTKA